jgi:anti-sigma regulatory factor (Ser/Thr protein kinase)
MSLESSQMCTAHEAHVAFLYLDDDEICREVADYLASVIAGEAAGIVIATEAHWRAIAARLERDGADVAAMQREERLFVRDAPTVLAALRPDGRIDPERFDATIGGLVRRAARGGLPVRAFGEMVMLLWERDDAAGALELESLWNELGQRESFSLLCGYRHDAVSDPQLAEAFAGVCHAHAEVSRQFPANGQSPRAVRRFLEQSLAGWRHAPALLHDALIVVSELATNSVMHAASAFTVGVGRTPSALRLAVSDGSAIAPAVRDGSDGSGNGIRMTEMLAADWGVKRTAGGKTVWAELHF